MKIPTLALALLTLALATGCGDDDEPTTTASSGATGATGAAGAEIETKADWIAAADQICEEASDDFAELAEEQYPEGPPEGQDAIEFGEDVVIPNLQDQHHQIEALSIPEGEEDQVNAILDGLQEGIDELSEDPGSFVGTSAFEQVNALAQDYGLKECGSE